MIYFKWFKWLLLLIVLLVPLGCDEDGVASVDVVKKRITNHLQNMIGKSDIAIQKYENKISEVKHNLIKLKVSRKTFEQKVQGKKSLLASLEKSEASQEKITLLSNTIQDMETLLQQVQVAETKLEKTYQKLVDNLELVKLKITALEVKRDTLNALRTMKEYTNIEGSIDGISGGIDSTLESIQKDIYAIEAEIEIENLLTRVN